MNNPNFDQIYLTIYEKFFLFRLDIAGHLPYCDRLKYLYQIDFIEYDPSGEVDAFNATIPLNTVHTTDTYRRYKAYRRNWLSFEYVVSHILVPIAVGVLASVITSRLLP